MNETGPQLTIYRLNDVCRQSPVNIPVHSREDSRRVQCASFGDSNWGGLQELEDAFWRQVGRHSIHNRAMYIHVKSPLARAHTVR